MKNGEEVSEVMKKNAILTIKEGQRVSTSNPGGGGWGHPFDRDPAAVTNDVRNGYVSIDAARVEYGVVINPNDFSVDQASTQTLRSNRI